MQPSQGGESVLFERVAAVFTKILCRDFQDAGRIAFDRVFDRDTQL